MNNNFRLLTLAGLMMLGSGAVMAQNTSGSTSSTATAPSKGSMKASHHTKSKKSKAHHSSKHANHAKKTATEPATTK